MMLPTGLSKAHEPQEIYQSTSYYFSRTNPAPGNLVDAATGGALGPPWYDLSNGISYDMRSLLARAQNDVTVGSFPNGFGSYSDPVIVETYNTGSNGTNYNGDTVISMRLDPVNGPAGDARLLAMTSTVPSSWFIPHYAVSTVQAAAGVSASSTNYLPVKGAHSLTIGQNTTGPTNVPAIGYIRYEGMFGYAAGGGYPNFSQVMPSITSSPSSWVGQNTTAAAPGVAGVAPAVVSTTSTTIGDFCNGIGAYTDGAIIPKPDDSTSTLGVDPLKMGKENLGGVSTPYFEGGGLQTANPYFSPARQLSGPVAFGVLPTGVQETIPWRTLCFNPNPVYGPNHIGLQNPKDHLLLDLFWMPVVEPYAISEPLSTAGKINMNYEIEPFNYINRKTALYAAMKSDKIFAIPTAASRFYKNSDPKCAGWNALNIPDSANPQYGTLGSNTWEYHFPIDIATTLQQFDAIFTAGSIFRSASQICEIFLQPRANPVYTQPTGFTLPTPDAPNSTKNIAGWWNKTNVGTNLNLTGVNGRQQPYAHLYSLLTTKSNTFQVHMRVQVLTKNSTGNQAVFDESAGDSVVGEYRGSAIVERYVDANETKLPDFANTFKAAGQNTLDPFYRFRIVSTKAFTPK